MFSTLSSFLPPALQSGNANANNGSPSPAAAKEDARQPQEQQPEPDERVKSRDMEAEEEEQEITPRRRKEIRTHETFIIVRPPPSKTNHPLNLQVQLVPPSAKDRDSRSRRASLDEPETPTSASDAASLARTISNRSDTTSVYSSAYASSTSLSSTSTNASSSTGRRMIIPLYNLQAHNVLTNVIVDAGTDAKVAKFGKRGMEVIGLALVEPVEVWGAIPGVVTAGLLTVPTNNNTGRTSSDQQRSLSSRGPTPEPPTSPGSSAYSLSETSHNLHRTHSPHPPPPIPESPATTPTGSGGGGGGGGGARKLFGKLFKKKESGSVPSSPALPNFAELNVSSISSGSSSRAHARTSSITVRLKGAAGGGGGGGGTSITSSEGSTTTTTRRTSLPAQIPDLLNNPEAGTGAQSTVLLRPAVLGIQPSLSSPMYPPQGRPTAYVWVIRRWLKGAESGLLDGMMGMLNDANLKKRGASEAGAGAGDAGREQVELRFEWTRGRTARERRLRAAKKREKKRPGSAMVEEREGERGRGVEASASNGSLRREVGEHRRMGSIKREKREKRASTGSMGMGVRRRRSVDSHRSVASNAHSFETGENSDGEDGYEYGGGGGEEDDEESDPEDSETPWTCSIIARKVTGFSPYTSWTTPVKPTFDVDARSSEEVKVKVAQLRPTPHHPKVVARLRMPYPLPDIEVESLQVRKRVITPAGIARPATIQESSKESKGSGTTKSFIGKGGAGVPDGLILKAEEIKDVVSSTGMWLVVREGIGGVGKISRKGDGWRIRG